jgi:hypothetical protein
MQPRIKGIFFFLLAVGLTHPCLAGTISGTVRSADGTPLANVNIYVGRDIPETKTAADGTYRFEISWKATSIFVTHPGFRPAARVIHSASERIDILLEPESSSTWWLPACSSEQPAGKIISPSHGGPRLLLPKGVKYRAASWDIDVQVNRLGFGSWWNTQYLYFWIGTSAGGPRPPDYMFEQSTEFTLRYWRSQDKSQEGVDARGSDSKGQRWRHLNIGSNSIMYRQVSDAAAKFFDEIIDSMCMPILPKAQPGKAPPSKEQLYLLQTIPYKELEIIKKPLSD